MPLTMNEKSKNLVLQSIMEEHETCIASAWACILTSTPKLLSYTLDDKRVKIGSAAIYCYIGITTTNLYIVTLHTLDVTKVTGRFCIALKDIQGVSVKYGLLKASATLNFGKESITILWSNQASGTDMKNQRGNVKTICDRLSGP